MNFFLTEGGSLFSFSLATAYQTLACITCNKKIQEAIFNSTFYPNLFWMLSPFLILGVIVAILSLLSEKRHKAYMAATTSEQALTPVPLASVATILGIGIGGFIDGIFLHQILQWHEMISNKLPPTNYIAKSVNMFWDGIFHAFTLIVTIVGIVLLWKLLQRKNIDRSGTIMVGGLLSGWGLFNIVEGVMDHHVLKLHNVREVALNINAWNYGFLIFSVILITIGYLLMEQKRGNRAADVDNSI